MHAFMTGMLMFRTVLLVLGLRCLACLTSDRREVDSMDIAHSEIKAAAAGGEPVSGYLWCHRAECQNQGFVYVGDVMTYGYHNRKSSGGTTWCTLTINEVNSIEYFHNCSHAWRMEEIGYNSIHVTLVSPEQDNFDIKLDLIVITEELGEYNILCNGPPCTDNEPMKVGDKISIYMQFGNLLKGLVWYQVNLLPALSKSNDWRTWHYVLEEKDLGSKRITLTIHFNDHDITLTRNIMVISDTPVGVDIIYNGKFCQDNEIMRFGDEISCHFEPKSMLNRMTFTLQIDEHQIVEGYPCMHVLREEDVGKKSVGCYAKDTDGAEFKLERAIDVVCDLRDDVAGKPAKKHIPFSMDMMCNGKFCQDNEAMRFGDEISCNFEPKSMLDRLTFSLLIDGHAIVEGYPCMHVLREEDVGTKLIECHANGTQCGPYQITRNISVVCAFRDDVIWEPVKRPFDIEAYKVKFKRGNVTYHSDVIILCGDEPCDKPGRIIYSGTYVTCRLRDGKLSNLKFLVNDQRINAQRETPYSLSEISYKFQDKDYNRSSSWAKCFATGTAVKFINETSVTFTVRKWPCLEIKQASADIMLEHGEAAGAIDGGLTETIDEEPAAGNKDGPKWNDDEEPAAGNKDGPKENDGIPAEKSAKDDESKPNSGNGQGSFVLLQLFLAFIAAYVDLGQF